MKELMKKVLTDKNARNVSVLSMFLMTAVTPNMVPWETVV